MNGLYVFKDDGEGLLSYSFKLYSLEDVFTRLDFAIEP
jgi:hypothetical protein